MTDEDPNSYLFGGDEPDDMNDEAKKAQDFVYGLNGNRVSAMNDLWFENLYEQVKAMKLPNEKARMQMVFKMTAQAVLDMFADSQQPETAPDTFSDFDIFMGVALTNMRYKVNLFAEQQKALESVDPDKYKDKEEYARALSDFEDAWWDIPQPLLDGRNPNDAIKETLKKYGLNE
ncbi:MAG: hypothetical protein ACOX8X_00430 [Methanomethylophilus sp.]|jgi:hypothetical protein